MNSIVTYAALLAILAWTEGSLVVAIEGLTAPAVHRGLE
jgi:hypothetical protein